MNEKKHFLIRLRQESMKQSELVFGRAITKRGTLFHIPEAAITSGIRSNPELEIIEPEREVTGGSPTDAKTLIRVKETSKADTVEVGGIVIDKTGTMNATYTQAMREHPDIEAITVFMDLGFPPEAKN